MPILDINFHQGNGTRDFFYGRDDALLSSLHEDPVYASPRFLGCADETGSEPEAGYGVDKVGVNVVNALQVFGGWPGFLSGYCGGHTRRLG